MTDEFTEIEQVKIRYRGQCPKAAGHGKDAVIATAFVAAWMTFMLTMALNTWLDESRELKREAVKRGFAVHNSETGKWQWR